MRAQVNGELAGVAAGVGADLAFEGPLVVVDAEVLLQAAAVRRRVQAVFAFVRLLARVRAAVHVELVPPTEALVAQLALEGLLTWRAEARNENRYPVLKSPKNKNTRCKFCSHLCGFSGVAPCLSGRTAS